MHYLLLTQLCYIKTFETPTCFGPRGIIIRESVHQLVSSAMILYVGLVALSV